jgi:phage baseplate assembly protein V
LIKANKNNMDFHLKYGVVCEVQKGKVKVHFEEDAIPSDWLPVIVRKSRTDKDSWPLEVNEHVCCLMDCYLNTGVVIGAIYNDEDTPDSGEAAGTWRKKFSDGTILQYNKTAHKLTVDVKGSLEATTTQDAKIVAGTDIDAQATVKAKITAPNVEITGAVKITGAVQILGALSAGAISTVPGAGGGSGNMTITGDINITGGVTATGDVTASGKSLVSHYHSGVQTGPGQTGPPV